MLDFMRRNARSWVVKVALGIIAVVFIFFMGGGGRIGGGTNAVATVGGEEISLSQYQQVLRRNEAFYREQYGDRLTPELLAALDLPSISLNQLVESAILRTEAERLGMLVPDEAVRSEIRELEIFQSGGGFSPSIYRNVLLRRGMSPQSFEESLRQDLLAEQIIDVVRRGVHVTEDEAFDAWREQTQQMVLSYAKLSSKDFEAKVTIDDAALQSYFDAHAESYRHPETMSVRYLAYGPDHFTDPADSDDETIEEYYVLNEDEFATEETVSARHILKKVAADADEDAKAAARAAIEKVQERLRNGEDFATVAEEESEDPGSAASGGDLGTFGRGKMVAAFDSAAFALQPGETSDVVESPFGFHIIHVYAHNEAGTKPLADVHDEIAAKVAHTHAVERAFDSASADALELHEDRTTLDKLAATRGLEVHTTPMFGSGDVVPGVGPAPEFVDAAAALAEPGQSGDPVHVGDTYYLIQLAERRASRVPDLDEVRTDVERDYRKEHATDLAREKASQLLEQVEGGKPLAAAAEEVGAEVADTVEFNRSGSFIPDLGSVPGLKEVAFQTSTDGEALPRPFVQRGDVYVFVRKSLETPDREEFEKSKDQVREALHGRKEQEAIGEFIRELKEKTDIAVNQRMLDENFR